MNQAGLVPDTKQKIGLVLRKKERKKGLVLKKHERQVPFGRVQSVSEAENGLICISREVDCTDAPAPWDLISHNVLIKLLLNVNSPTKPSTYSFN